MPTDEEIEAARSPAGGWTRATLASWGVPWPPPSGWKKRLTAPVDARASTTASMERLGHHCTYQRLNIVTGEWETVSH